ncbi:DUF2808 domain-containing protein [Fischerella thermalis CCMEE 5273]|uniref:DUF2808 domain-containing protein n=1 Tax=Chlorogloeopsis fritschii PCC 6912 TaxID=211165 RepID=A0A3S1A2C4_CHLFR|nr:DUF2808 domain-containing protein [Chlorogloeopsis fritschii]PMB10719.1 DUF2808 domain-containing protein [Fischerella thermalis CCMEE 5273]PMB49445.1 DUF2808 domain-containing protein [Fischerella thermalis CCMEE 5205]RUR83870.1 hypothetical protein PCC6912_21130 [Chlorogloeopsis fritschii PCC 6912]
MKNLIYAGAFTLAITSLFSSALASGKPGDFNASHLVKTAAYPNDTTAIDATHKFEVHVQGKPLAELGIDLPEGVIINDGIEVKNQSGEKVPTTVSINDRKATVAFSQPVAPETKISVFMRGVNTPRYEPGYTPNWQYQVYAKKVGLNGEIPLGLARIQTYPL